jgi:hypothetical protein
MSKNLNNLRRLFSKLQLRYGDDDALVLQLKRELEAREALEAGHQKWSVPYRDFIKVGMHKPVKLKAGHAAASATMN